MLIMSSVYLSVKVCFYLIVVDILSNVVIGAPHSSSSTKAVSESESVEDVEDRSTEDIPVPKISRKELYEILQKRQFFQDIFSAHLAPLKFEFGHVCENPTEWEQRFEQKDFKKNRHQGKILWGNVNGNYGEHYWDLASGR
ncbi:uncharacterized protein LOC117178888 [Belonocnema kinseyi]|uniref:uncharacterized protein LOC117178888 n=1 Tax=Belonocnema kinseyi TaxID=2817044 RepID=UPI00143D5CB3|nr:uncharacterized protein LOC117178888 [Belonocnema kinseyi]XP_033226307.1 uncharacterized protein LOC117178888 [Belonocnema kinseyi]